jgi:hypothetical protein
LPNTHPHVEPDVGADDFVPLDADVRPSNDASIAGSKISKAAKKRLTKRQIAADDARALNDAPTHKPPIPPRPLAPTANTSDTLAEHIKILESVPNLSPSMAKKLESLRSQFATTQSPPGQHVAAVFSPTRRT